MAWLYEHGHRGAPAVAVSSARPATGRAACPLVGQPKSAPQHGALDSYSAARSSQCDPDDAAAARPALVVWRPAPGLIEFT